MRKALEQLNKLFDSRVRIGIMSALMVNETMSFIELKQLLDVTDGNLASHMKALEEHECISVQKGFIGRKTNTTYSITPLGATLFRSHIHALEEILNQFKT